MPGLESEIMNQGQAAATIVGIGVMSNAIQAILEKYGIVAPIPEDLLLLSEHISAFYAISLLRMNLDPSEIYRALESETS